jgi:hypothetical protein
VKSNDGRPTAISASMSTACAVGCSHGGGALPASVSTRAPPVSVRCTGQRSAISSKRVRCAASSAPLIQMWRVNTSAGVAPGSRRWPTWVWTRSTGQPFCSA